MGLDAGAVGREARRRRAVGERVAVFVGEDPGAAETMAGEMLGGLDELVVVPPPDAAGGEEPDPG